MSFLSLTLFGLLSSSSWTSSSRSVSSSPCASSPCGANAECWSSSSRFLCTCSKPEFGHGNPYVGCHQCRFDDHCHQSTKCIDHICVDHQDEDVVDDARSAYDLSVDGRHYFVGNESLTWPQAQYVCASRQGHLAEMTSNSNFDKVVTAIQERLRGRRVWVGATDFRQREKFVWYHGQRALSPDLRHEDDDDDDDEDVVDEAEEAELAELGDDDRRCVYVSGSWWGSHMCESPLAFLCQYNPVRWTKASRRPMHKSEDAGALRPLVGRLASIESVCGRRFVRQGRIVGGGIASYGEWPWQVSLLQRDVQGEFRHKCGAALITHTWILSAAHCVHGVSATHLLAKLGEYNTLSSEEPEKHVSVRISKIVQHSRFNAVSYEYDIALLKMDERVEFGANILPICLPSLTGRSAVRALVGRRATVTGWGRRTAFGSVSPVLREVHLPIISNEECMHLYKRSGKPEWIPNIFVCAGGANGGQDSCEGDSGGPLVVREKSGRFQLAGIISWGIGCGQRNRPGVYTRVSHFKRWIERHTHYSSNNDHH